ncbi:hypothetical protein [Vibrio cyclitrophicus]|uniref:hypothetical protein n=1 Tax=Vibrio cyclitrophicus TaxID=47951 RepID=UPI001055D222|nr:hypothetical protein [Vibrio cyclitrophicus]
MKIRTISIILILTVTLPVLLYALFLVSVSWPIENFSIDKAGIFGDSFGIITSLFSGLAFCGMIITILLQKEELKLQRLELSETRGEIKEQKDIFKNQMFNDSFYKLLEFRNENLKEISVFIPDQNHRVCGVQALVFLLNKFTENYKNQVTSEYVRSDEHGKLVIEYILFVVIQNSLHRQGRYLGTLKSIYALIDSEIDSFEQKQVYWDLVSSQLTVYETKYLFYSCLVAEEGDELRNYLHQAKFFENRCSFLGVSKTQRKIYEKYHGITLSNSRKVYHLPFEKKELRKIKRTLKESREKKI